MRLSVKVVGGCECECDASPDSSVEELKRDVEAKLKLGKETEQKLLFRGKALQGRNYIIYVLNHLDRKIECNDIDSF